MNKLLVITYFSFVACYTIQAQHLVLDTIFYSPTQIGVCYQTEYPDQTRDTIIIHGLTNESVVYHKYLTSDTLVIVKGWIGTPTGARLTCEWYALDGKRTKLRFPWTMFGREGFFWFQPTSLLIGRDGKHIPQQNGRVPTEFDNLVFESLGNIYEIVDGEKVSYGRKYFEELKNDAKPEYQWKAFSLLAKHIGKENLDPKVARWYFKE